MLDNLKSGAFLAPVAGAQGKARQSRGRLKIFFGMAPGVGKTRAMIRAAHQERLAGRDVVLVCLEDSQIAVKNNIVGGLPSILQGQRTSTNGALSDLPVDAVLARRPDVAVVDELAHDNGPSCRHPKRFQDVQDLLGAGIDVFTTLNVGQVASRVDDFRRITGADGGPVVPDTICELAELELVDLAPRSLLARISRGEVRLTASEASNSGLLEEARLRLLRELTVRYFAERVGHVSEEHAAGTQANDPITSGQRLLAIVRLAGDSVLVVHWAHKLAQSLHAEWIVVYVESSRSLSEPEESQVTKALATARELGADVITTSGPDQVAATLRVAAQRSVTQLIVGKAPESVTRRWFGRDDFVSRLLHKCRGMGIHIVPLGDNPIKAPNERPKRTRGRVLLPYAKALGVITVVTLAAFLFTPLVGAHATALVYLLTVVLLALFVERGPALVAAAMSALLWDYFFLPPIYAFQITHVEDAMLFGMYFVVALVLGHLTTRIRAQEESERERESRATVLYLLTRDLNESVNLDHMVQRIVEQLETCFKAKVAVLLPDGNGTLKAHTGSTFQIPEAEKPVALWALHHLQRAGKLTKHLPTATGLYVPLVTSSGPLGVLGLSNNQTLGRSLHQENLIDAVSQQIAMALDRHRLNGISEKAKLLAESERLSQTLLDSMSHEIRTPIAAIQSATGNLAELPETDSKMRLQMIAELQEATERLNRLVGNVLEASRLESGTVKPRLNECDVSELIHVVLEESEKDLSTHVVTTAIQPGLPVMPMDFVLMQQALANLVSNAALHTPAGTSIEVGARLDQDSLLLTVADRGPGIPADCLPRIFDKFYRLPNSRTGGTGLGLSLVKGFVEAQGGKVAANNQPGGGVVFTIRLPRQNSGVIPEEAQL